MSLDLSTSVVGHDLRARGEHHAAALVHGDREITHGELDELIVRRLAELDLPARSVAVLHGSTSLEFVVTYLALLAGGHVPLLAGEHHAQLANAWDPAAVIAVDGADVRVDRRPRRRAAPHPDLALLLSTSGSTGGPKLVRLSARNLLSNAASIGESLRLSPADRGITSLPLHYCYGLSVLHSHLFAGASVVISDASVVDPCFRTAMRQHGVTSLAGVPHTFEMLERSRADQIAVPSLRLITQAGGRMAPADVVRWARRATEWGAEFVVMYGQTEATARIAYLPSTVAERHPDCIGFAVPGGSLRLHPVDGHPDDIGELVYRGDNVMMGYAERPRDLTRGAEVGELFTGDLARHHADDGVFQIVGRRSRFVKPLGLRIDLDHLQAELARSLADDTPEVQIAVTGDDERLRIAVVAAPVDRVTEQAREITGLPPARLAVAAVHDIPRTDSGKIDFAAVQRVADDSSALGAVARPDRTVSELFRTVLGARDVQPTDTFVSLGGDSMGYVECSIRLEALLGHTPTDWHLTPVSELRPAERRTRFPKVDTTVVIRALGICLVVATHMGLFFFPGGAHTLLAVAGYNLARFMGSIDDPARRWRAGMRTAGRIALPTATWVAIGMLGLGAYSTTTLLFVNNYAGPESHAGDHWHFWFMEAFIHLVLLTTALLAIPAVRRVERRWPFRAALVVLAISLIGRMDWAILGDAYNQRFRTHSIAFYFVAGWLIAQSTSRRERLVSSAVCLFVVPGFFGYSPRDWFIAGALLLLVWFPELPLPRWVRRPVQLVAMASMWILITHFTVWPIFTEHLPLPQAYALTLVTGIAVACAFTQLSRLVRSTVRTLSTRPLPGAPTCVLRPLDA